MNISVTKNQVSINTDYILNDKEYNVNKCYFSFSEEYTDDLVKKAVFIQGSSKIEMSIINNQCEIPSEVLNQGTFEIHVYAYEVDGEELVIRYSPTYDTAYVRAGSYVENTEEPEVITPTQFEQYMKAMNDGLNEVANVDIDSEQLSNGTSVTITNRYGESQTTYAYNGQNGADGADGKDAKINGVNTISIQAGENVTIDQTGNTLTINSTGGGSGGTSDYTELSNKPKINNVELDGNKTTSDLGIVIPDVSNFITKDVDDLTNYYTKVEVDTKIPNTFVITNISDKTSFNVDKPSTMLIAQEIVDNFDFTNFKLKGNVYLKYVNENLTYLDICNNIYYDNHGYLIICFTPYYGGGLPEAEKYGVTLYKNMIFRLSIALNSNKEVTNVFTASVDKIRYISNTANFLGTNNTTSYTPTGDYNPATKKYVDDIVGDIESLLGGI
jgi:hypothetical protein